ncbi:MAG: discoidin domain-containing protein [Paludibacteraceae bacterium]
MKHNLLKPMALVAMMSGTVLLSAAPGDYDVNFALASNGATASATSGNAALAIDGSIATRWESEHGVDPQELIVDLGEVCTFNTVQIVWEGAYATDFTVSTSNDRTAWNEVASFENLALAGFPYTQQIGFDETSARYVRFNGTKRALNYGYSFYEFRVLRAGAPVLTTLTAAPATNVCRVGEGNAITLKGTDQNGAPIDLEGVAYTVTPAEAGTVTDNVYTPAQMGLATIEAYVGEVKANAFDVFAYEGVNAAFSSQSDNKVIDESAPYEAANSAFNAVDGNAGSLWQGCPTGTTTDLETDRTYDAWFVLDLGFNYDINLIAILFEGACSQDYHIDFSADNTEWQTGYTYIGKAGIEARTDYIYGENLQNANSARYVRFWSTKAATQYGMKVFEFQVFGKVDDKEKPVMISAQLESTAITTAILAVEATDNLAVAEYHVVDAAQTFDKRFAAADGKIAITELQPATTYTFTITAIDLAENESDNAVTLKVEMPAYNPAPVEAAPLPTQEAQFVMSVYSDAYTPAFASLNSYNEVWWDNPSMEEGNIEGDHYLRYFGRMTGMVGWQFQNIDVTGMQYLHVDIWPSVSGFITMGPTDSSIAGNHVVPVRLPVTQEKWNSFDIRISTDLATLVLDKVFQNQFTGYADQTEFSVDNVYFWKNDNTGLDNIQTDTPLVQKLFVNGQLVIIRDGIRYNALGQLIE